MTVKAEDKTELKKCSLFWRRFWKRSRWVWIALVCTLFLMASVVDARNSFVNIMLQHGASDIITHEGASELAQQMVPEFLNFLAEDSGLQRDEFDQLFIDRLIDQLQDPTVEPGDRAGSVYLLSTFEAAAKSAVPALAEALMSDAVSVRVAAAYSLGCIGTSAEDAIAALKKEIENEKHSLGLRVIFAGVLGKIGPKAVSAVASLEQLMKTIKTARQTGTDLLTDREFDTVAIALERIQVQH